MVITRENGGAARDSPPPHLREVHAEQMSKNGCLPTGTEEWRNDRIHSVVTCSCGLDSAPAAKRKECRSILILRKEEPDWV